MLNRKQACRLAAAMTLIALPIISHGFDTADNPLAEYQTAIEQAHSGPVVNETAPAFPALTPPAQQQQQSLPAPSVAAPTAENALPPSVSNQPSATSAGPPNIFATPGSGASNSQSSPTIHY